MEIIAGTRLGHIFSRHAAIDSVAVMPFVNVGDDPGNEYLSDGITESLINSLSQNPTVKVRSRNAVFRAPSPSLSASTADKSQ